MKTRILAAQVAVAAAAAALTAGLTACGQLDDYGYGSPAYVTGTYTCTNPYSGQPDYCVEYDDGSSQLVPFPVYSSACYGCVLSYAGSSWHVTRTSWYTGRRAPDVYHVHYVQYYFSKTATTETDG